mgnify:CR=1 FL=1
MDSLATELDRAKALDVTELADAIETIGFECTRCGACCKAATCGSEGADAEGGESASTADDVTERGNHGDDATTDPHTATVFPDEIRQLQDTTDYDWRDVARPMPYGLETDEAGQESGATFEWALQTDDCGDCTFYDESDGVGACTVHEDRPLICRTYPFSVALGGTSQPMGEAVDAAGMVRAHECEGLGRAISRADAESLAAALKERAVTELEEAIAVRDNYEPLQATADDVVVYDSEGAKRPDGTPFPSE